MTNKIKLRYLGKKGFNFKFEEVETGKEIELKIWKTKPFINTIKVGKEYFALLNENWVNELDNIEPEINTEDLNKSTPTVDLSLDDFDEVEKKIEKPTIAKKETTEIKVSKSKTIIENKKPTNIKNVFETLNKVKCVLEKKSRFNYVSWTDAWGEVMKLYPTSTFKVYETESGFPAFIKPKIGGFVKVGVTINEIEHIEHYPITDNNFNSMIETEQEKLIYGKMKTIPAIDSFAINTAIKRGMVKALAYFGLGLYVYKGEDLPEEESK